MTTAVCFSCGEFKRGSFVRCEYCDSSPRTDEELMVSLVFTDRNFSIEQLEEFRDILADGGELPEIHEDDRRQLSRVLAEWKTTPAAQVIFGTRQEKAKSTVGRITGWLRGLSASPAERPQARESKAVRLPPELNTFEDDFFTAIGARRPSPAQITRARLAFACGAAPIMMNFQGEEGISTAGNIVAEIAAGSRILTVTPRELFSVTPHYTIPFKSSTFFQHMRQQGVALELDTRMDGTTAIMTLFEAFSEDASMWVGNHSTGPFGPTGATLVLMQDLVAGDAAPKGAALMHGPSFIDALKALAG